jgi:hypothetical protein
MATILKLKIYHWILGALLILVFALTCYAASPQDTTLSQDTKEWLKLLLTIGIVPLLGIVYNQGKREILNEIKGVKDSFKSHWHLIDCDNPDCDKPKTTGLYIDVEK